MNSNRRSPHGHPSHPTKSSNIDSAHPFAKLTPHIFALIIGINKYESPNIPNLVGAVPDADAVRDYLQELGVPSSQIRNLRNNGATRAAIIEGIKAFSLNDEIKVEDPILIFYAGHGGSADTPKGWEVGSTGKVELLVPYDHSSPLDDGKAKHGIPDRTLGALLSFLAIEKGDNITVILDCCYSATVSGIRNHLDNTFKVRAIDVGNVPSNLDEDIWSVLDSSEDVKRGSVVHSGFARKDLRSHVLLAACRSQEFAYERTSSLRGVFTEALINTLVEIGINKLTYATLFDLWMPTLSSRQNPQCEGVLRDRSIFNLKASGKRTASVYSGETYAMPDTGPLVARNLSSFSTTLDGFLLKSRAGAEGQVRIHVADESLKNLVKKIDPNQRIIQLVERDHEAEFGMALENGKVVFNIYDSDVTKYGLTRMSHTLKPTLGAISPVLRAAAHFYWHRRRTLKTGRGLAGNIKIELTELQEESFAYDDDLNPVVVYGPTASGYLKGGKEFDVRVGLTYGWKIINNWEVPLYPALFYFDISDWSITPYYQALGIAEPPLKGKGHLTVGHGNFLGSVPHTFYLREGQNVDVGILKLFLSRKFVSLSHIVQSSPFLANRGSTPLPELTNLPLSLDTVEIPVVQRRADK